MNQHTKHVDQFQMLKFLQDLLNPRQEADLQTEIGDCPICTERLATLARIAPTLRLPPRYQLRGVHHGGMGIVFAVWDLDLKRVVALKIPIGQGGYRFENESVIAAKLEHPSIPAIFDRGILGDGRPFFVMRYLPGDTLLDLMTVSHGQGRDRGALVGIFFQLCKAVAYAHSRRIIHRDLKPQNVMIDQHDIVQVVDWGLAKELDAPACDVIPSSKVTPDSIDLPENTQEGVVLGTRRYMSPEQAAGKISEVDERADVYALAVILLEILSGDAVHIDETPETPAERAARVGALIRASTIDGGLGALMERCLSLERKTRPRNAGELFSEFQKHLPQLNTPHKRRSLSGRQMTFLVSTSGALAAFILGMILWPFFFSDPNGASRAPAYEPGENHATVVLPEKEETLAIKAAWRIHESALLLGLAQGHDGWFHTDLRGTPAEKPDLWVQPQATYALVLAGDRRPVLGLLTDPLKHKTFLPDYGWQLPDDANQIQICPLAWSLAAWAQFHQQKATTPEVRKTSEKRIRLLFAASLKYRAKDGLGGWNFFPDQKDGEPSAYATTLMVRALLDLRSAGFETLDGHSIEEFSLSAANWLLKGMHGLSQYPRTPPEPYALTIQELGLILKMKRASRSLEISDKVVLEMRQMLRVHVATPPVGVPVRERATYLGPDKEIVKGQFTVAHEAYPWLLEASAELFLYGREINDAKVRDEGRSHIQKLLAEDRDRYFHQANFGNTFMVAEQLIGLAAVEKAMKTQ